MTEIAVSRDVAAPPDRVWEVLIDLDQAENRISGITSVERLAGDGFTIGTRWRETRTVFGREATEEMEVTAIDPGRSYTVEADSKVAYYTTVLSVEPSGDGSTLTMTLGSEPKGTLSKIGAATIGKLFEGTTRKMIEQDLADIAAAAQAT